MKKTALILLVIVILVFLVFASTSLLGFPQDKKFSKGSMFLTGQVGVNSFVATDNAFDSMPFPIGASYEFSLTDTIGIGGTIMFDKWSDYLGCFCGKFTFHVFKPSLDFMYHFNSVRIKGLDFFAGVNLGYSVLAVSNELGNENISDLHSESHFAPFLGTHFYFWENDSGFLNNILVTLKVSWSVTGDFSGVYGAVGITYKIK
jgi:hypothetical protein